jgi:alcohol dehydrogenase (NADP+)
MHTVSRIFFLFFSLIVCKYIHEYMTRKLSKKLSKKNKHSNSRDRPEVAAKRDRKQSSNSKFVGYAVKNKGDPIKKWSYTPRPLGEDDVEVLISHCGLCGSDIHAIDSEFNTEYPVIVGHEIVGTIINKGHRSPFNIGERVGVGPIVSCKNHPFCYNGLDSYSPTATWAYNSKYPDGQMAYGGLQERVRVSSDYVFRIPNNFDSAVAAPLLCAGVTTYVPLVRYGAGIKRKRIGIIGIGGLGHVAIQFANKMGAEVTAISSGEVKRELSFQLGAHHYINASVPGELKRNIDSFDLILNTASNLKHINSYIDLLDMDGIFVQIAIQKKSILVNPDILISKRIGLVGSLVGSKKETQDMLHFAANHNIAPRVSVLPMTKVNEAVKRFRKNEARFRFVLENK